MRTVELENEALRQRLLSKATEEPRVRSKENNVLQSDLIERRVDQDRLTHQRSSHNANSEHIRYVLESHLSEDYESPRGMRQTVEKLSGASVDPVDDSQLIRLMKSSSRDLMKRHLALLDRHQRLSETLKSLLYAGSQTKQTFL